MGWDRMGSDGIRLGRMGWDGVGWCRFKNARETLHLETRFPGRRGVACFESGLDQFRSLTHKPQHLTTLPTTHPTCDHLGWHGLSLNFEVGEDSVALATVPLAPF